MSIIRERIRLNNQDINLKIRLSSNDAFTGYQQEIDNLTTITTNSLINPVSDAEVRKFKYFTNDTTTLRFYFYNSITDTSLSLFNGFTASELASRSSNVTNSFFILEYYDSYDIYEQNKIFTTYLTKISTVPVYVVNSNNQLYNWYIPISYIESQTGSTNTITGYTRFSFYNAKTGKVNIFYNNDYESDTTSKRMYFKTILNKLNKTWEIQTPSYTSLHAINAKELKFTTYQKYSDRINDTFENFENLAQSYPTGNTFDYTNGSYFTI